MMEILDRYGGWPVVKGDKWPSDDWDWLEMNKKILHDGLPDDLILECRIRTDFMNSTKRILQVKLFCVSVFDLVSNIKCYDKEND